MNRCRDRHPLATPKASTIIQENQNVSCAAILAQGARDCTVEVRAVHALDKENLHQLLSAQVLS